MQGNKNSDLTDLGVKQAEAIANSLSEIKAGTLISSDLGRAMETAQIISEKLKLGIVTNSGLRERNLGIMEGLTYNEFKEKHPDEYRHFFSVDQDYIVPKGESSRQRYERNIEAVEEIVRSYPGKTIVLIIHGGVLDSLIRKTLSIPLEAPRCFSIFNASINTISVTDEKWTLVKWGDIHHLKGMKTIDDWW